MTVTSIRSCTGCEACVAKCPSQAITIVDDQEKLIAKIDPQKCIGCNSCFNVCPVNNEVSLTQPISWYQGWANGDSRINGSSGGIATQLMLDFISDDSFVCSCIFDDGFFRYYLTNNKEDIKKYSGSKYVRSKPTECYSQIKKHLASGHRVLFIGIPCHVAALKSFLKKNNEELLYTVDLICHGTPSPVILKDYLNEKRISLCDIHDLKFRKKTLFRLYIDGNPLLSNNSYDSYMIGFRNCLFYSDCCYECRYAQLNRISDITLGDSWGTELITEKRNGVSLILCQTMKGKQLIDNSDLSLFDVDLKKAVQSNHQLETPSQKPKERSLFYKLYRKKRSVSKSLFRCYPTVCLKQQIKYVVSKVKA